MKQLARLARRKVQEFRGTELALRNDASVPTLRLGSLYGGWAITRVGLPQRPIIFSVGLGRDVTFDLAAIEAVDARVYGFDPTPKSREFIQSQAMPAAFSYHDVGLAAHDGTLTLHLPRADFDSFSVNADAATAAATVICPVKRLATLKAELNVESIDILKIDIEGSEYDVIPDLIESGIVVGQFLVEFHYDRTPAGLRRPREAIERLRAAGYRLFKRSVVGNELSFIHQSRLPS